MPSPIPGMDPFLEDPAVFPDLHDNLIAELRNAINAQLPPPYYASSASRVAGAASRPLHAACTVRLVSPVTCAMRRRGSRRRNGST